jgi:hypothetical protein
MGGACRLYEGKEQGMQDFCAESEGKRQIGRHIGTWGEDNIKLIFQKYDEGCVDYIDMA